MNCVLIIFPFVLVQLTSAQLVSYGIQNGQNVLQNYNANIPRTVALQNGLPNTAVTGLQNIGVSLPISNPNVQLSQTIPTGSFANNLINSNIANSLVTSNLANANYVTSSLGNANNIYSTNLGANIIPTGIPTSNIVTANANLLGNNVATIGNNFVGANLVNANLAGQNNLIAAAVPVNLANGYNINTGTFAVTNTGLAQYLNQPCGIQILADALEVGGSVGVNGQMPFYTTITANGQLPSSGYGYASCGCGQ
ncbi:hypothetical protein evm_012980 [Chilo suppressalis]|nr:hypothetical protein evm_012980 [Chilo suppressalis]